MGLREIVLILLSLLTPALALGAVFLALRARSFDFSRLPRKWIPPGVTAFMMLGAATMIIALNGGAPPAVQAADADWASEEESIDPLVSRWIRVYPLENWGDGTRRKRVGEEFSKIIIEVLRDDVFHVRKGVEKDGPVGLYETSVDRPLNLIDHYRKIAPFISVTGYISTLKDGRLEAHVTLSDIDATVRSSTIIEQTVKFPDSPSSITQTARQIAEAMIEAMRSEDE